MIYLDLFLGFLKVGCFSFGGAYAAIPLIREIVLSYGWLSDEALSYMIAVSESTPGPIMVNLATYVGSSQAGIIGSLLATFAVVLPAFAIILLVMCLMRTALKNKVVQAIMSGMKPAMIGIILSTGVFMTYKATRAGEGAGFDIRCLILLCILLAAKIIYQRIRRKKLSPLVLIALSALLGAVIFAL